MFPDNRFAFELFDDEQDLLQLYLEILMAGPLLFDRVKETTTTTGTGTITLAGAETGFRSFSVVGNGNTCAYVIAHQSANEWEVGIGTYTSTGTTLSRTKILASSNGGSLVSFSAGTKDVFLTMPAIMIDTASAINECRLSLDPANAIITSNQQAKTTIHLVPYRGNKLRLFNGSCWEMHTVNGVSVSVPATTNTMFDIFAYINSGTPAIETLNWTNDTTRATALSTQEDRLIKSGDATRLYLGSGRTTGTSGQCETSLEIDSNVSSLKFYLWNYYNQHDFDLVLYDSNDSWNYTTNSWRQVRGSGNNQIDFILGLVQEVTAFAYHCASNTTTGVDVATSMGLDSTTVSHTKLIIPGTMPLADGLVPLHAQYTGRPAIGKHYLAWLEKSAAAGTTTWYGDANIDYVGSGITLKIAA